jgi:Stress responsive A/B Barrel Domain
MSPLADGRVRHAVVFSLKHEPGSDDEAAFLEALRRLASVPGVEHFELGREVSPKNAFAFGLVMEFADRDGYEAYNGHPEHVRFVAERWDAEVADFLEIDTVAL